MCVTIVNFIVQNENGGDVEHSNIMAIAKSVLAILMIMNGGVSFSMYWTQIVRLRKKVLWTCRTKLDAFH